MPHTSAVYHLDFSGRIPPGHLIHIEDRPGGRADIYLHPLHANPSLVSALNWATRHQVGNGLWRQNWTDDGRMQQGAEGLGVAESRWEIVPGSEMPRGKYVFPVEQDRVCVWLIRKGCCTAELRDAMNEKLKRIAGDGLWLQVWPEPPGPAEDIGPAIFAPLPALHALV